MLRWPTSAVEAVRSLADHFKLAMAANANLMRRLAESRREQDQFSSAAELRRLARLDALLASEEPPEGLVIRMKIHSSMAAATKSAWRWLRDTLRGPVGAPVPEKEPDPEAALKAREGIRRWTDFEGNEYQERHVRRVGEYYCVAPSDGAEAKARAAALDAELGRSLVAILSTYCGERGDSEGAEDTLWRIIKERDALKAENSRLALRNRQGRDAEEDLARVRERLRRYEEKLNLAGYSASPDKISYIEGERKRLTAVLAGIFNREPGGGGPSERSGRLDPPPPRGVDSQDVGPGSFAAATQKLLDRQPDQKPPMSFTCPRCGIETNAPGPCGLCVAQEFLELSAGVEEEPEPEIGGSQ